MKNQTEKINFEMNGQDAVVESNDCSASCTIFVPNGNNGLMEQCFVMKKQMVDIDVWNRFKYFFSIGDSSCCSFVDRYGSLVSSNNL